DGYVRQGKRETRVRVTAVVDFRKAPSVQDLLAKVTENPTAEKPSAQKTEDQAEGEGESPVGITGALVPSTAGRVVYYRVN
ncbi:MAG TPA: hypothetical protein VNN80_30720, partial [Polyangiaceae bacterium]|nr:hypothetical protein [Polyangiaceae bacterium]